MALIIPSMRVLLRIFLGWSILVTVVARGAEYQEGELDLRGRHVDFWNAKSVATRQENGGPSDGGAPADPVDDPKEEEKDVIPTNPPPSQDPWYKPPEGW